MIRGFVGADSPRRALVLAGRAGIGKTTLWEAGLNVARERGLCVLSTRASSAEAQLAFAGLIDLCDRLRLQATATGRRRSRAIAKTFTIL